MNGTLDFYESFARPIAREAADRQVPRPGTTLTASVETIDNDRARGVVARDTGLPVA